MKIQISSVIGTPLYEGEHVSFCKAVEAAIKARANLEGAYLEGAYLEGAYLEGANLPPLVVARTSIVPYSGAFVAWKKLQDGIVAELLIPAHAERNNATGRKCRASEAQVVALYAPDGTRCPDGLTGFSRYDGTTEYRAGQTVKPDRWDPNRWNECSNGIHFFITRVEAENYEE